MTPIGAATPLRRPRTQPDAVRAQFHVVVRPDPFRSVDHAALERGAGVGGWREDGGAARPDGDLVAERRDDAHLEALVVAGPRPADGRRRPVTSRPPGGRAMLCHLPDHSPR